MPDEDEGADASDIHAEGEEARRSEEVVVRDGGRIYDRGGENSGLDRYFGQESRPLMGDR
jgi:hypothetical protein